MIVAAGDIACSPNDPHFNGGAGAPSSCKQRSTSDIFVTDSTVDRVLALGDLQYECASYGDFLGSYAPSWGRAKTITRPALGNHEYITGTDPFGVSCPGGGGGYFQYFAASPSVNVAPPGGYYSWDIGSWHMVVLNSNCKFVSCKGSGAQVTWLKSDLAASNAPCTLAYWHHPRFNGKKNGPVGSMGPMWKALEAEGAEVILNGHKHAYARFAPLTTGGAIDQAHGIRQFIVGTGGENIGVISNHFAMVEKIDPWASLWRTAHDASSQQLRLQVGSDRRHDRRFRHHSLPLRWLHDRSASMPWCVARRSARTVICSRSPRSATDLPDRPRAEAAGLALTGRSGRGFMPV